MRKGITALSNIRNINFALLKIKFDIAKSNRGESNILPLIPLENKFTYYEYMIERG